MVEDFITNIGNKRSLSISETIHKNNYVCSPMNYIDGKYKLLPQLLSLGSKNKRLQKSKAFNSLKSFGLSNDIELHKNTGKERAIILEILNRVYKSSKTEQKNHFVMMKYQPYSLL